MVVRVHTNMKLSEEASELLLKGYESPDSLDVNTIGSAPYIAYLSDCRDRSGNPRPEVKLGYRVFSYSYREFRKHKVFSFDNGRKYFAIAFRDAFNEDASYTMEYFDGTLYVLRDNMLNADWSRFSPRR